MAQPTTPYFFGRDCPHLKEHVAHSCQLRGDGSWDKWRGPALRGEVAVYAAKARRHSIDQRARRVMLGSPVNPPSLVFSFASKRLLIAVSTTIRQEIPSVVAARCFLFGALAALPYASSGNRVPRWGQVHPSLGSTSLGGGVISTAAGMARPDLRLSNPRIRSSTLGLCSTPNHAFARAERPRSPAASTRLDCGYRALADLPHWDEHPPSVPVWFD
jgi:hypothetical protein